MKVLYVSAEATPFIKTGGLADVAGSLPQALKEHKIDIRVVLPLFVQIEDKWKSKMKKITEFYVDLNWKHQYCGVYTLNHDNITYYFLDNQEYFFREQVYGELDDAERFIFFSKAVTMLPQEIDWKPDIIHANDWHSGLVPVYVNEFRHGDDFYDDMKTVYTIHNLKYQGQYSSEYWYLTGFPEFLYNDNDLKHFDAMNMMKGGIVHSNAFSTVSPTYAEEIQYPFFGETLDGVIRKHSYKLWGILNGIDYNVWNPKTDDLIDNNYDPKTVEVRKKNKIALQKLYELPENAEIPLIGMVTRLTEMKGMDLVQYVLDELLQMDLQFVVLGTGDTNYEEMLSYYQWKYPKKMASRIYYSNAEAHKIYSSSDLFLMPSVSEPCGLSQMISMKYGALPIVREAGGLKDSVEPYNEYTGEGTGFTFSNINAHEMMYKIKDSLNVYKNKKNDFKKLVDNAMKKDLSWDESSKKYIEMYESILD